MQNHAIAEVEAVVLDCGLQRPARLSAGVRCSLSTGRNVM